MRLFRRRVQSKQASPTLRTGEYRSVNDLLLLFGIAVMSSKAYACYGRAVFNLAPVLLLMSALVKRLRERNDVVIDQNSFTPQSYVRAFQPVGTVGRPINYRQT